MTARELAHQLRRVRLTDDMVELRVMVARALMNNARDDATDTLLQAIEEKMGRIAASN